MLRRSTKIQLVLFVIVTLLGVSYVSAKYVGLTKGLFGSQGCTVSADFPDSGGIFTDAEVTYRGVSVGRVGQLQLIPNGVRVALKLDNCTNPAIPASTAAQVSDRSVVGEQYVNLVPQDRNAPFLTGGQVIPMSRNKVPVASQVLLTNLDNLVNSVNIPSLRTTVSELGKAFSGRGQDLGTLLDANNNLLQAALQNLPATESLIQESGGVLQTQLDEASAMASWAHSLNLLSQQLKASDPDIRSLIDNGPSNFGVLQDFLHANAHDLGVTFANLASTGQLLVKHIGAIEEIYILYPALAAGAFTVIHPDGISYLGFVPGNTPPDCGSPSQGRDGYEGTRVRAPSDLSPAPPNTAAHCTLPSSSGTNVRGAAHAPGGDPISTAGGDVAYPRVTTADTVTVGSASSSGLVLGDRSWIAMLTDGLH